MFDPQPLAPRRVQRMLGVDERGHAPVPLGLRDRVQRDRRLAARLRAEHLDDPAARQPLAPQCQVKGEGAGGDPLDLHVGTLAQPHDRTGTERFLDLT